MKQMHHLIHSGSKVRLEIVANFFTSGSGKSLLLLDTACKNADVFPDASGHDGWVAY